MKKFCTFIICLFLLGYYAEAQYVTIPDEGFRTFLKYQYPASFNASDMLDTTSSEIVNEDSLSFIQYTSAYIKNINELKYFKNLTYLDFSTANLNITEIPELPPLLEYLDCSWLNGLTGLPALPNSLKYINLKQCSNIKNLPDLPPSLVYLNCDGANSLTAIPLLPNSLTYLNCSIYHLLSLPDLSGTSLLSLDCWDNFYLKILPPLPNTIKRLDLQNCYNLETLPPLSNTSLEYINISWGNISNALPNLPNTLDTLICFHNLITGLPTLPANMSYLNCNENQLSALPSLPTSLTYLDCGYNKIEVLPSLPNNLGSLNCSGNLLTTLPIIPSSLKSLSFYANKIPSFPLLPNTLKDLDCGYNPLHTIPIFPDSLISLSCDGDSLTTLPTLPQKLDRLSCANNQLSLLPTLPSSLTNLNCRLNELLVLPKLPDTLSVINCAYNKLSELPDLPTSLRSLSCFSNNIFCLPKLPELIENYFDLYIDLEKIACIPNKPANLFLTGVDSMGLYSPNDLPLCTPVTNVSHCQSFAVIQGSVFGDINSNVIKDANEFYIPSINIRLSNGSNVYTDKNGHYEIGTYDTGHYDLTILVPYSYYTPNPILTSYYFTTNDTLVTTNIALQPNATVDSFKISLHEINFRARPGFSFPVLVTYENIGTTTLTPNIIFNYDNSLFTYDSSSNHNVINNGTNLSLTESSMLPGEQGSFYIYLKVKTTAVIGTWFTSLAAVSANSSLAQDSTFGQISGSFDPNDKQATPIMSTTQVSQGKFINYTIRFQNTGTDTAFTVVVTDTLSALLQENTFELINASHPCNATRDGKNLTFEFLNILLPDSNVNELGSHGFISFRVKPKSPLALNTIISNKAFIYFDYNLPVITNTAQTYILNNTTVPIKLVRFYANALPDGYTQLNWVSANEINTNLYTLQESTDGVTYKNVSSVAAKGFGNNQYAVKTLSVNAAVVYYRLKVTDVDGSYAYSSIITVKKQSGNNGMIVSNNVTGNNLLINVQDGSLVNTTARVLSTDGVVVKNILLKQGVQNINVGNLATGNYYLQTNVGTEKITIKK